MKILLSCILFLLPLISVAEPNIITIPGQGWSLVLQVPPLISSEGTNKDGRFRYIGSDTDSGITFSIFTEDMADKSNTQCRDKYLTKTKSSPNVIQDSVELFETPLLAGTTYRVEGTYMSKPYKTANSHGYFVKNGKCVDIHVSQIPYTDEGRKVVEAIVITTKILE